VPPLCNQLYYGEDGLDVMKVSYMKQTSFLAANAASAAQQLGLTYDLPAAAAAAAAPAVNSSSKKKKKKKKDQQQQQEQPQPQPQQQVVLQHQLQAYGLLNDERYSEVRGALLLRQQLMAAAEAGDQTAVQQLKSQLPLMAR
jgi:hypothetical protein